MRTENIKVINWLVILFSFLVIALKWRVLPPQIPLFYSRPWGEDQLAGKEMIFLIPVASFGISLINEILARVFFKKAGVFFEKISFYSSFLISILGCISLLKIIFLVD